MMPPTNPKIADAIEQMASPKMQKVRADAVDHLTGVPGKRDGVVDQCDAEIEDVLYGIGEVIPQIPESLEGLCRIREQADR